MLEPPSRNANPFATCWTGTAELPYQPTPETDPHLVVRRLVACEWRAQIVGPHGAGKSALLSALAGPIAACGRHPVSLEEATGAPDEVVLAEGFERMSRPERRRVLAAPALVLTAHRPVRHRLRCLPVVARPRPDARLLQALFRRVTDRAWTPVTPRDAAESFARRRGNLREVWFDLYDLHERRTHPARTAPVAVSYTGV